MKYDIDIVVVEGLVTGKVVGTVAKVDTSDSYWEGELHGTEVNDTEMNLLAIAIERTIRAYEQGNVGQAVHTVELAEADWQTLTGILLGLKLRGDDKTFPNYDRILTAVKDS